MTAIIALQEKTKFCTDWRNRRLAHFDYLVAINKSTKELELASREKAKTALTSIAKVLNTVSKKYLGSTTAFDFTGGSIGGAGFLLYYLHYGIKNINEREERILNHKSTDCDFEEPDI